MASNTATKKIPAGYKQTDAGVIPEDWDVKKLSDCLVRPPRYGIGAAAVEYSDLLPKYIRITDISEDGRFLTEKAVSVDNPFSVNYFLSDGDLVVARTGASVGKSYLYRPEDGPLVFAGFLICLSPDRNKLLPQYLGEYLKSASYWNWVEMTSMRSGQPGINGNEYARLLIPVPEIAEQKLINKALSETNALIEKLEKLIEKKKNIKQGAMQELLTGKRRLTGFSGEWIRKKLGEIGELTGSGVDKKIRKEEVPVRLLNFLDVFNKTYLYSKELNHEVTAKPEQLQKCSIRRGDIFFTPSSEMPFDIGISAVAMEDMPGVVYSYHVDRFRLLEDWDLLFRAYIFQTKDFTDQTASQCEGSGKRYVLNLTTFRERLSVCYPVDRAEQSAISKILFDMDAEIERLESQLVKYQNIKQGMMQTLLTGKIRLIKKYE